MVGPTMLVIDASVAVKFLVKELGSPQALQYLDAPDPLIAPDFIVLEVANALWRKVKTSELLEIHTSRMLDDMPAFFAVLHPSIELIDEAFRLSFRLRHPVYDCLYLALAMREQATLVTADRKFVKAVERGGMAAHMDYFDYGQSDD
jgi:predicted nucleic acid-binding protein